VITDGRAFQTAGVLIADIIQVKRGKNVGCPELLDKQWYCEKHKQQLHYEKNL
jgi:hypothetical protein